MNNDLRKKTYWYVKRLLDIIMSLILIITLPFMLLTVIAKKMNVDNLPRKERYTKASYFIDKIKLNELQYHYI